MKINRELNLLTIRQDNIKPVWQHLAELRSRLLKTLGFLLVGSLVGWFLKDHIIGFLTLPLGKTLYYTSPGGGLTFLIQVSLLFGLVFTIPFLLLQLWAFLAPAFPSFNGRLLRFIFFFSLALFISGVFFSYLVILPAALALFGKFEQPLLTPLISADTYLSFASSYLLSFGLLFEISLFAFVLGRFGVLKPEHIQKTFTFIFAGSFILSAVITPTADPLNQSLVALPILFLFALSWFILKLEGRSDVNFKKQLRQLA